MKLSTVFSCALILCVNAALAKQEYREIAWAWCLVDCGSSGDFESPQAAIDALNAYVNQRYDQCVASAQNCGNGCYKVNRYNLAPAGGFAIVNGVSTWQTTRTNISTSYVPACNSVPAQTTIGDPGGGTAVYGKSLCPSGDWSEKTVNPSTVIVDGMETTTVTKSCQAEIPDPPPIRPKSAPVSERDDDASAAKFERDRSSVIRFPLWMESMLKRNSTTRREMGC